MNRIGGGSDGARSRRHLMPHGAEWSPETGTRFRLWAPAHARIDLVLDKTPARPMQTLADGWHELTLPEASPGMRYRFRLPDGLEVPDPASRFQPEDVHGPSQVIDPAAYAWQADDWHGRPWHEAVIYELHIGAFTPEGTFRAAIGKLDHLVSLGVNAIEIMPVADFPGRRNWGYDGVLLYAPDSSYGRPEDFKALVDAAHARGVSVLLDVVYNHFGPEGNYLSTYAPGVFTERHHTPWGAAINYDGPQSAPVRDFVIHNALYWIEEFNLDGLRLDAVHAIVDDSDRHLLREIAERVRAAADRPVHLILENENNGSALLRRRPDGSPETYTAQWNDDVHHVLHVAASGEDKGYYVAYKGETELLGRALAEGFAYQGEMMDYRGRERGEPSAALPPQAFVAFLQNHDQIGNRAFGDRITAFAPPEAVLAVSAVYLLLPQVPMLFMGEEWASRRPFPFFCDFSGDLAEAVRRGRREEFKRFPEFQEAAMRERIPDPLADETFASAKLDWNEAATGRHRETLDWFRRVLATRRERIVPIAARMSGHSGQYTVVGEGAVELRWRADEAGELLLRANLKATPQTGFAPLDGDEVWREGEALDTTLGPWAVLWSVSSFSRETGEGVTAKR